MPTLVTAHTADTAVVAPVVFRPLNEPAMTAGQQRYASTVKSIENKLSKSAVVNRIKMDERKAKDRALYKRILGPSKE